MGKLESRFESETCRILRDLFPGCILLKNDSRSQQGIPDRLLLWRGNWAFLEFKKSANEAEEPNQRYFVEYAERWAFGAFIYPENAEEVLDALQQAFRGGGPAR